MTPAGGTGPAIGFGPVRPDSGAAAGVTARRPRLDFPALDGLRGLAVPFVLAFALRADLARLGVPDPVRYLADGGYLLVDLFLVLAGFLLARPLAAVLTGTPAHALGLASGIVRRIAPLHLVAVAITIGWAVTGAWTSTAPADSTGARIAEVLLINSLTGTPVTGDPLGWSVSAAVIGALLLIAATFAVTHRPHRPGRPRRTGLVRVPVAHPERLVTVIGATTAVIGLGLLLPGSDGTGVDGRSALGQALLGLGVGVVAFRLLEGATGSFAPPMLRTVPARIPAAGAAALQALAAALACVYRSDLVHDLDLLPMFPVAGALIYFLAAPGTARSGLYRLLTRRLPVWLGSRALALYLLYGPVQLTLERVAERAGVDRASMPVAGSMLVAVTFGALAAAEAGHRWLEYLLAARPEPDRPRPAVPLTVISLPGTSGARPERLSRIDEQAIPSELRLLPLPTRRTDLDVPKPVEK